jgi:ferredoxin--NADP+ reductase
LIITARNGPSRREIAGEAQFREGPEAHFGTEGRRPEVDGKRGKGGRPSRPWGLPLPAAALSSLGSRKDEPRDSLFFPLLRRRGFAIMGAGAASSGRSTPKIPKFRTGPGPEEKRNGRSLMFTIASKSKIAPKEYDFWVEAPRIAAHARAGQFVVVRPDERGERIPLTIADYDREKGRIRILFQVVGKTTAAMAALKKGDALADVAGPLGTPSEVENFGTVLMVGGGVGIAALYPILKELKRLGNRTITVLGGRTRDLVIMKEECAAWSDELIVTTDDGSEGLKGLVTDAMRAVAARGERIDRVWAIGPTIMMKFCAQTAAELGLPIWVSLNPIMVDGTGMCGCCRVTVDGQIRFACVDGPEFDGSKVNWGEFLNRLKQYRDEEKISYDRYAEEAGDLSWL